jgi:hypothetical protein
MRLACELLRHNKFRVIENKRNLTPTTLVFRPQSGYGLPPRLPASPRRLVNAGLPSGDPFTAKAGKPAAVEIPAHRA